MALFNEEKAPVSDPNLEQQTAQSQADDSAAATLLAGIVNEKGEQKYATIEAALGGLTHAQSHIATLAGENATYKDQLLSQEQLKELVNSRPADEPITPAPLVEQAVAGLTVEDVAAVIAQQEQVKVSDANIDSVQAALAAQFGADAEAELVKRTADAGLSQDMAEAMAKSSPSALLKLLDVKPAVQKPGVASAFNAAHEAPKAPEMPMIMQQLSGQHDPVMDAWRESVAATNARLGL